MNKTCVVLLVALMFPLQGCVNAASIIANLAIANALGKNEQERKADKCAALDTQAEKDKVSRIERNRRLTAADCPL